MRRIIAVVLTVFALAVAFAPAAGAGPNFIPNPYGGR